ncbi:uncharacterized protein B0T23DRAFT_101439 [Neurospora hispaniola]|uniref:Uncharacterized protein n=1 Tax=Neurospora hispaniola TaxID=588809 RepID=A0AAJ0MUI1_9PEZI|nr:hypothetical protein B0T23DRAFT_101439 [Neurospora hispaniola]
MDYLPDPLLLLIVTPHILLMARVYYSFMSFQLDRKSLRSFSPPPIVVGQKGVTDPIISRVIFAHAAWKWIEAIQRARPGLIPIVIATCLVLVSLYVSFSTRGWEHRFY